MHGFKTSFRETASYGRDNLDSRVSPINVIASTWGAAYASQHPSASIRYRLTENTGERSYELSQGDIS